MAAALNKGLDRIDAVERDQPAALEIEDGEAAGRRIAAQDRLVVAGRKAHGLELQVILVRPEPGHGMIGFFPAHDVGHGGLRLVIGVLHGFQADLRAPRSEEHTSELQSLMRTSYAVFCLKKKNKCNEQ